MNSAVLPIPSPDAPAEEMIEYLGSIITNDMAALMEIGQCARIFGKDAATATELYLQLRQQEPPKSIKDAFIAVLTLSTMNVSGPASAWVETLVDDESS